MHRSAWLIIPLLIALAAGLLVFGVSRAPEAAQATPDDQGPRIVALSPAIAVILTDLGEQDRIVGRAGSDTHLPGSIPVAGDYNRRWSDPSQLLVNQGPEGGYTFVDEWALRGLPFISTMPARRRRATLLAFTGSEV